MKSRDTLIRLKKFQVDEKRRQVSQLEGMIAEFERMANELDQQILSEQQKAGIHDVTHFAYPTFAKAAMVRKENLVASADGLRGQLEAARAALSEAFDELKKIELLDERDREAEKSLNAVREQAELDETASRQARV